MKIGEQNRLEPTIPRERIGVHGVGRRRRGALPCPAPDAMQVSVARAAARLLGRVDDSAPDPARAAQLLILRNAVASGRYQPDLDAVARKLLIAIAAEPRG